MATAMIGGKKVTMSIEDKARRLKVLESDGVLAVTSGTDAGVAYILTHNNREVTACPCKSYGMCAHTVAGNWFLEAKYRAAYTAFFSIYGS